MIIKNSIRCNVCGDEIESNARHEYVVCRCGRCAVDGGHNYLRRACEEAGGFTETSIVEADTEHICPECGGKLCAMYVERGKDDDSRDILAYCQGCLRNWQWHRDPSGVSTEKERYFFG